MPTDVTGQEHLTPVKITSTSATERRGFRNCRRQWFLTVVHRLDPQEGSTALMLGTLFHKGLEMYYKAMQRGEGLLDCEVAGCDAYQDLFTEYMTAMKDRLRFAWQFAEPMWREAGELGFEMLQNYFIEERTNPIVDEVVQVEVRVNVAIRSETGRKIGTLSVQTDLVGRKDGQLRVIDHKSATRDMPSAQIDQDDQLSAEAFAVWQSLGEFPDEVVYNVAKKKVPEPPKLLKSGKLSKDRSQDTTSELYEAAIVQHGLNRMDYADHLQFLREQERTNSRFFKRDVTFRTPDQVDSFARNLREEWRDMRRVALHPEQAYPNPSVFNCPSCPVRALCVAIEDGQDVEALIRAGYVVADPRR